MEFDKFLIGFDGLELGKHDFNFLVDTTFFKELEYAEFQEGNVEINALFTKSERLMIMDLEFNGEVIVPCDRCGEDFTQQVDFEESVVLKFGDENDEDEGIIILKRGVTEFDISHYLYESISLSLPTVRVHPEVDGKPRCDEAIVAKINTGEKKDNNNDDDNIDPRWAALKNLK